MKNKIPLITFLAALILLFVCAPFLKTEGECGDFVIIIDPGHGGDDGGAVSAGGICEKELNLDFALKLSSSLESLGYKTVMTRSDDADTDGEEGFHKRKDILNRLSFTEKYPKSIFVSVHMNSSTSSNDKGFTVFHGRKNEKSRILAEKIYSEVGSRAYVSRLRDVKNAPDSVYLMNNCEVPAILLECGFISNRTDEELLTDEKYREDLAYIIAGGIDAYCRENSV